MYVCMHVYMHVCMHVCMNVWCFCLFFTHTYFALIMLNFNYVVLLLAVLFDFTSEAL